MRPGIIARQLCTVIRRPLLGMKRNEMDSGAGSLCLAITANVIRGALQLTV